MIVRDVLDNQLVDRHGIKIGKVDGIILEVPDDGPPRLAYLEQGVPTLARRLHPRLGDWVSALGRKWGCRHGESYRIPWSKVRSIGIDVEVDIDVQVEETPLLAWENWLREKVIGRIPGSG
jgi:sporulation protein YlmC with PRC-barrel domain